MIVGEKNLFFDICVDCLSKSFRYFSVSVCGDNEFGGVGFYVGSLRIEVFIVFKVVCIFFEMLCFLFFISWLIFFFWLSSCLRSVVKFCDCNCWIRCVEGDVVKSVVMMVRIEYLYIRLVFFFSDWNRVLFLLWFWNWCWNFLVFIFCVSFSNVFLCKDEVFGDGMLMWLMILFILLVNWLFVFVCCNLWIFWIVLLFFNFFFLLR